jgi:hypothetical protein
VLKAQKASIIFAITRQENDSGLAALNTCLPGSGKGSKRLQEVGYDVKPSQMDQVIDSIADRLGLTKMKAEECCCKGLKLKDGGNDCNRPVTNPCSSRSSPMMESQGWTW